MFILCEKCKDHYIVPLKECHSCQTVKSCLRYLMVMCGRCIPKSGIERYQHGLAVPFLKEHYGEIINTVEEVLGKKVVIEAVAKLSLTPMHVVDLEVCVSPVFGGPRGNFRLGDSQIIDLGTKKLVKPSKEQIDAFFWTTTRTQSSMKAEVTGEKLPLLDLDSDLKEFEIQN